MCEQTPFLFALYSKSFTPLLLIRSRLPVYDSFTPLILYFSYSLCVLLTRFVLFLLVLIAC